MNWGTIYPLLNLAGGSALFLFAIALLSESMRDAATGWLRRALAGTTRSALRGLLLGCGLGVLMHSSATTVMLVSFIDAGLLSLAAAIPGILGANIGTTLAMQIVSFRIGDFWMVPLALGLVGTMRGRGHPMYRLGRMGVGFGLLLLGLQTMTTAAGPYREHIAPWLEHLDGSTGRGMASGILTGLLITVLVQSSGATIGMGFALIASGAIVKLEQIYPLILGAHIGTCSTALFAALRTVPDARRAAGFHMLANLYGVALAALAAAPLIALLRHTSSDLLHQAANAHTGIMLLAMLPLSPFRSALASATRAVLRFRAPDPETSHLDSLLLPSPERALAACLLELRRVARLGIRGLRRNASLMLKVDHRIADDIARDENVTDEIQRVMSEYLGDLATRQLSRRQALMVQHIGRCMTDIERIGDHNDNLMALSLRRHRQKIHLPQKAIEDLVALFEAADRVLQRVIESLDPTIENVDEAADAIMAARDEYNRLAEAARIFFMDQTAAHVYTPLQGMILGEYVMEIDRLVRHSRLIAVQEHDPFFWIKREKLERQSPVAPSPATPEEKTEHLQGRLPWDQFP